VFVSVTDSVGSSQEQSPIEVYRRANSAVVNITVVLATQDSNSQGADTAQGSGFLYDTEGRIVTNNHVVAGATRIEVTFADGSTQRARILGVDPDTDLAVLKVDAVPTGTQPLPLGDSGALQVGQSVAAIGNPFGLEGTLTLGIVSAIGRVVPSGLSQFSIPQVIQTDAAINPGNSGGPLLNLRGEVVGVNTQIRTADGVRANSGVGFAVPSNIVARVVPALIADGQYTWSWLGVRGGSVTTAIAQANSLGQLRGAYIIEVLPGGPADKAGLRGAAREQTVDGLTMPIGGDVVTAVDGNLVRTFDDLLTYIALRAQVGQVVQLTVQRDGREQTSAVTLDARPRAAEVNP
jgi:2-alkenal reductase